MFTSPEHAVRFTEIMARLGKISGDTYDNEYSAALYLLTSRASTWEKTSGYVHQDGIGFARILQEEDFGAAYSVLIRLAANLFDLYQFQLGDIAELLRLDEENYALALDAINIRRYGLVIDQKRGYVLGSR